MTPSWSTSASLIISVISVSVIGSPRHRSITASSRLSMKPLPSYEAVGHAPNNQRESKWPYSIKHFKRLPYFIFGILIVDFHRHHGQEFRKVYRSRSILIYFIDHVLRMLIFFLQISFCFLCFLYLKFCFRRILTYLSEHSTQLFRVDDTVVIGVKEAKCILKFSDLFFCQAVTCHFCTTTEEEINHNLSPATVQSE